MPRPETTDLCRIPGIGKNMEEHLVGLGYYVFFIHGKNSIIMAKVIGHPHHSPKPSYFLF